MITMNPIVRGVGKALRVTFLDKDTESIINTEGWTLRVVVKRSRGSVDSLLTIETTADAVAGAQGQISSLLTEEQSAALTQSSCVMDFSVNPDSGQYIPILRTSAVIENLEDYQERFYPVEDTSEVESQDINVTISNDVDPTFDVGVLIKFNQLSPETLAYLEALQADVAAKHADVMGV